MSELTLFALRIAFLAVLWLFIFGIVYALRSDLFGQRVRKLQAGGGAQPSNSSPFVTAAQPTVQPAAAPQAPRSAAAGAGAASAAGAAAAGAGAAGAAASAATAPRASAPHTPPTPSPAASAHEVGTPATVHNTNRLVITSGPKRGTEIPLGNEPLTIGRSSESSIVIRDDYSSTHHARLLIWNDEWMIQDLDSTNGTFLAGRRVSVPTKVPQGTPIKVGTTTFELRR